MSSSDRQTISGALDRALKTSLHLTPRQLASFLVVVGVLATARPSGISLLVGGLVSLAGEVLRILAAGYRRGEDELIVRGPYRHVRHPYNLGTALIYLGLGLAGRDALMMGVVLVLVTFAFRTEARRVEARLERALGPRFAAYRAVVPEVVPRLLPAPAEPGPQESFSLAHALLRGHRELNAALGLGALYGVLYGLGRLGPSDLFQVVIVITGILYILGRGLYFGVYKKTRRPVVS